MDDNTAITRANARSTARLDAQRAVLSTNVPLSELPTIQGNTTQIAAQLADFLTANRISPGRIEQIGDLLAREGHMRGRQ